ncbi:MAG: hypothetical protein FJX52_00305 [Alphaproteobacteria bacterium]|nr:hypothetical protein [Alphaproteobacteria bacterium]
MSAGQGVLHRSLTGRENAASEVLAVFEPGWSGLDWPIDAGEQTVIAGARDLPQLMTALE